MTAEEKEQVAVPEHQSEVKEQADKPEPLSYSDEDIPDEADDYEEIAENDEEYRGRG